MDCQLTHKSPVDIISDCIVIGIFEKNKLSPSAELIDTASNGYIKNILKLGDMTGKLNTSLLLSNIPNIKSKRVILIGCGDEKALNFKALLKILHTTFIAINKTQSKDGVCYFAELENKKLDLNRITKLLIQKATHSVYNFDDCKGEKSPSKPLKKIQLGELSKDKTKTKLIKNNIKIGVTNGRAMDFAKDLVNQPGNICTPSYLAKQAQNLAKKHTHLSCKILSETEMKKLGMHSLLSVSKGSDEPGKLIILEYKNGPKTQKPTVLIGKGVTFDTGGISLKPGLNMDEMKGDMGGAASVLATMQAVCELELKLNCVVLVPAVENMPSARATKPGDIVTSMSGQTIEILNTDAEGRLILCDALTYAERYKPRAVVDFATLTGAILVALGTAGPGVMANNQDVVDDLMQAAHDSGERLWQLPLWDEYQEQIKSPFADMANIGGRFAGSITAGCFLSRFAKQYPWAHVDIAGVAFKSGAQKGGTGRPVSMIVQYLIDQQ